MTSSWRAPGAEPARFARFVLTGGINTAASFVAYLALLRVLSPGQAYTLAYALGIGVSYLLNSALVFNVPVSAGRAMRFPLAYAVQYLYGLLLLHVLTSTMHVSNELAMVVVIATSVPLAFFLTRRALA